MLGCTQKELLNPKLSLSPGRGGMPPEPAVQTWGLPSSRLWEGPPPEALCVQALSSARSMVPSTMSDPGLPGGPSPPALTWQGLPFPPHIRGL